MATAEQPEKPTMRVYPPDESSPPPTLRSASTRDVLARLDDRVAVVRVGSPLHVLTKEMPNLTVEQLCSLHAADVTDAGHDDKA